MEPPQVFGIVGHQEDAYGNMEYTCVFDREGIVQQNIPEELVSTLIPKSLKEYQSVVGLDVRHFWDFQYLAPGFGRCYVVEDIFSHRYVDGVRHYAVRWIGYTFCTEQVESDFINGVDEGYDSAGLKMITPIFDRGILKEYKRKHNLH